MVGSLGLPMMPMVLKEVRIAGVRPVKFAIIQKNYCPICVIAVRKISLFNNANFPNFIPTEY
jgi:hypothetical protein